MEQNMEQIDLMDAQVITSTTLTSNLVITFYFDEDDGTIRRFTKTISGIKQGATNDALSEVAKSVSKVIEHTRYDIKVVTTNLIDSVME
ncbi:hypothetical protein [Candidatus Arthromitus sp. SFB-rat-Yit]|uniref:DUF1659 domain-containing protein n=1 Tax=Candidatus Arthromitus sp. SFB-rat-Yit TaxID=1041504 RepID=UPI000309573F|nr:hypothetical protein [Candidatus Arthromitus sp. SFB-rat-Yit]